MQKQYKENKLFSLLSPTEKQGFDLSGDTENDLDVDFITKSISHNNTEQAAIKKILLDMPVDTEAISYRQGVYSDLREHYDVCEKMYEIFDSMRFYIGAHNNRINEGSTIYQLIIRLKSLDNYIESIRSLKEVTDGIEFRSEAMKNFSDMIQHIYTDSGFDMLSKDIEIISSDINQVRSLTIGVNLDDNFYPREVGITSLNSYWFTQQSPLQRFIKFHGRDQIEDTELQPFTMETHNGSPSKVLKVFSTLMGVRDAMADPAAAYSGQDSPLMNNLTQIIDRMLPSLTEKLKKVLNKYVDISGQALGQLADEVLFYLRFIELEKKLTDMGMPCCIGEASDKDTSIKDLYNLKLALCKLEGTVNDEIICNDIEFTNDKTVQILTGPNRGGKTILTQGIGIAFLMYHSGVFVPAGKAEIKPCSGIFTHFPVEEERTVSMGRLGEEAERFNEICDRADGSSLLLFNESFVTTSPTEALYIAEDVIRYLCCTGARTVFNTHMHELAEKADELSQYEKAVCKAVSVVMEGSEGKRSYRISYKKPDGKSYAHDIAYKYGITFEQLSKRLG